MSYQLIIFTDPPDAVAYLTCDSGIRLIGTRATHSTGRLGTGFTIPDDQPNVQGALLQIEKLNWIPMEMRGILELKEDKTALFITDDFHLQVKPPVLTAPPPPVNTIPSLKTPLEVIKDTLSKGNFDLKTKEGCGSFTEACVKNLHVILSNKYGHIRKIPPQNMFNGHAVDALMLLEQQGETKAGIYDIILANESAEAKPHFIYRGEPEPNLWYYPA